MTSLILALTVLAPLAHAAVPLIEESAAGSAARFSEVALDPRGALERAVPPSTEPILQPPLTPTPAKEVGGETLGRFATAAQLDRHFEILSRQLGARQYWIGAAADAGVKSYYLTLTDAKGTALAALGELDRLRGPGINVRIDAQTSYNFKVKANIFDPVRGSTLLITPLNGTQGPAHSMKTGEALDGARAKAAVFNLDGEEYWVFYGRDVRPDGSGFADTRSFLFAHLAGLSSKAWPLAQSALRLDTPSAIDLGGAQVVVTLTSAGDFVVQAPR